MSGSVFAVAGLRWLLFLLSQAGGSTLGELGRPVPPRFELLGVPDGDGVGPEPLGVLAEDEIGVVFAEQPGAVAAAGKFLTPLGGLLAEPTDTAVGADALDPRCGWCSWRPPLAL